MKYLIMLATFLTATELAAAQAGGTTKPKKQNTNRSATPAPTASGQYHGSKDTTPGSPMGTGGAGGGDMSGSHAASATGTQGQRQLGNLPNSSTSQSHGSRDTTPGSPMGTGGAGGGDMSGSPAGLAIETPDQKSKRSGTINSKSGNNAAPSNKTSTGKNAAGNRQGNKP